MSSPSYRSVLAKELLQRKAKNPAYSLRSFARDLEISPTALSQALNSRRDLSKRNLSKLCAKLPIPPALGQSFFSSAKSKESVDSKFDRESVLLEEDSFYLVSHWYHYAIHSLAATHPNSADPDWIAKRLGIRPSEAREALKRLIRLNLVAVRRNKLVQIQRNATTTVDVPSSALRSFHREVLHLAIRSLERTPVEQRDISSMTMSIRKRDLARAKSRIQDFRRKLCQELEVSSGDSVYTLAIQLFPMTGQSED